MSEEKHSSLEEYYNDIVDQTVSECTLCGECINNCNLVQSTPLKDKDPEDIIKKTIDLLRDGVFSEEVYHKAFACSSCGYCSESCPQGIDIMEAFGAARSKLVQQGKFPEAVNFVEAIPGLWGTVSALQTRPAEATRLRKVPSSTEKTENVVFLGCSPPALPHNIFAFLDVLERMGINFVALAGGELCCGTAFCPAGGKVRESEEKARELVTAVKAFSPERVIHICNGCYRQFTEFFPSFLELDFEVEFYSQFLNENLEKINFTKPLEKTVTLHEACMTRRTKVTDSVMKLLEAIPGLKLVAREHIEEQPLCCGGLANMTYPQIGQKLGHILAEEIIKTGTDYIANTCSFCALAFYPYIRQYSFEVKGIATLVNQSAGGREYEDKLAKYWRCKSVEEIIEKSRENFEANGYTEEEMRHILPLLFAFPGP